MVWAELLRPFELPVLLYTIQKLYSWKLIWWIRLGIFGSHVVGVFSSRVHDEKNPPDRQRKTTIYVDISIIKQGRPLIIISGALHCSVIIFCDFTRCGRHFRCDQKAFRGNYIETRLQTRTLNEINHYYNLPGEWYWCDIFFFFASASI